MQNLYQKYRPQLYSQMVGQDKIIKELSKRSIDNNLSQVILFEGMSGIGKTCLSKITAKSILCQSKNEKGEPCNQCSFCQTVNNENISNYFYEYNASNLNIEELRQLEDLASKKTLSNAKARVFVIDELQEIATNRTQKNILKLLEKPLKNIFFILGTMDGSKIDKAIKNRCTLYKLQPLSVPEIVKYLMYICKEENILLDTIEKKQIIISLADTCMGSMRAAISNLERVIYSDLWSIKELQEELSIISNEDLNEMVNQLLQGDINLLNNKITDDILKRIKFILNLLYKFENKLELNAWQKQQIGGIKKCNVESIEYTIAQLNELNKFPYLPSDLIEFEIINIIRENKKRIIINNEPKLKSPYIKESEEKPKERQARR